MLELQSLKNQVISLKLTLDRAISDGCSFEEVKTIYMDIKETARQLEVKERQAHLKNNTK